MQPTPLGFHCAKCSKELIDFREKTDQETHQIIAASATPICGVFKRPQMSQRFLQYAAASFIASATALNLNAQTKEADSLTLAPAIEHPQEAEHGVDETFCGVIETQAAPIGGYQKLYEAIVKSIKYPQGLKEPGKVFVQFTVDTSGKMHDIKVVKSYDKLAAEAIINALQSLDFTFKPGTQQGVPVKSRMVIPIILHIHSNE